MRSRMEQFQQLAGDGADSHLEEVSAAVGHMDLESGDSAPATPESSRKKKSKDKDKGKRKDKEKDNDKEKDGVKKKKKSLTNFFGFGGRSSSSKACAAADAGAAGCPEGAVPLVDDDGVPQDPFLLAIEGSKAAVAALEARTDHMVQLSKKYVLAFVQRDRQELEDEISKTFSECMVLQKAAVEELQDLREMREEAQKLGNTSPMVAMAGSHAQHLLNKVMECNRQLHQMVALRESDTERRSEMLAEFDMDPHVEVQLQRMEAEDGLAVVTARHQQCLKLEKDLTMLRDLMADLAVYVSSQQAHLDAIEHTVNSAADYTAAALTPLQQARRFQMLARHKKIAAYSLAGVAAATGTGFALTGGLGVL